MHFEIKSLMIVCGGGHAVVKRVVLLHRTPSEDHAVMKRPSTGLPLHDPICADLEAVSYA